MEKIKNIIKNTKKISNITSWSVFIYFTIRFYNLIFNIETDFKTIFNYFYIFLICSSIMVIYNILTILYHSVKDVEYRNSFYNIVIEYYQAKIERIEKLKNNIVLEDDYTDEVE